MTEEKNPKPREFILFVDTNTVWTKEEHLELFAYDFLQEWEEIAKSDDVTLIIPNIGSTTRKRPLPSEIRYFLSVGLAALIFASVNCIYENSL